MPRKLNPAERRYLSRFAPAMIAYVAVMAFEKILFRDAHPQGLLAYVMAIAPAIPIIGVIAAMTLYLSDETDEYLRLQHAKAMIIAAGATLSIATVWGFMEDFGLVPHVPAYWAFILFGAALALARGVVKLGDRG
jgi:hypothetical protein